MPFVKPLMVVVTALPLTGLGTEGDTAVQSEAFDASAHSTRYEVVVVLESLQSTRRAESSGMSVRTPTGDGADNACAVTTLLAGPLPCELTALTR